MNARIFGVSKDDVASHKSFRAKFDLPFPLIADTDRTISEAYGAVKEKNMFGKIVNGIARVTFVIDGDGRIIHVCDSLMPATHVEDAAEALERAARP